MEFSRLKKCVSIIVFLLFIVTLSAQDNNKIWDKISKEEATVGKKTLRKTESNKSVYFKLDINKLKSILSLSSKNTNKNEAVSQIIQFPNSEGGFNEFSIKESSTLDVSYQKKHPELKTYIGYNTKNPSSIISFSVTPQGLHAMTLSSKTGTQFIDPYSENNTYIIYNKGDLPALKKEFRCFVTDEITLAKETSNIKSQRNANDSRLRTFRLALASTIEYSEFHWQAAGLTAADTETDKKAAVLDAMVVTMNRVNTIFQRDLAIKMILVDNTDIIFIDSDNFTNDDASILINESQVEIDNAILTTDYDIGHTFSRTNGGDGIAQLNSPCRPNSKAMGVTGLSSPVGDAYDIDFVAHELGHQFGAPHTFNGNTSNCSGNNRQASNAYEPGSGNTIMAYAGICPPQNIQLQSDAYFHQKSIQMIWDNITNGFSTCGIETTTTNNAPTANAGPDYTIPISTAYKLIGNSTDPDGTSGHTYTWEQYDLGPSGLPEETNVTGPLVRSFEGTINPIRNIPNFVDYIASGGSTTWEKIPSVNRTMTFALTVRDNDVIGANGAGQTAVDFMNITVNSADSFTVVNPSSWAQGTTQTIEWVVGQTADVATINCQTVNIKLSTDGGITFPTSIATGIDNNGSFSFTVPLIANTSNARILIEAADNIFYDVSDFNFSISDESDFFIIDEVLSPIACGDKTIIYNFDYVAANGFSDNTIFSASGIPGSGVVSFSPESLSNSGNVTMTITNLDGVAQNNYDITVTGTSSTKTKNSVFSLPFFNDLCVSSGTTEFSTSTTLVQFNTINQASGKPSGYTSFSTSTNVFRQDTYDLTIQVNTDGSFTTNTKVWIDWNQDCEFDVSEEYNMGTAFNVTNGKTSLSPMSIIVPLDAVFGSTIMRVSTKFEDDGMPNACENGFDGEVEDYIINILEGELNFESSITSVEFNTINQTSDKTSSYTDFTSLITDVNRGDSYDLSVNVSTFGDFTTVTKAWIDWNQNSSFDDAGEEYDLGPTTNVTNQATSESPLSITIPVNATLGHTIMRVVTLYEGDLGDQEPRPLTIGNGIESEVEDYTVNILSKASIERFGFENLIIYPNPNKGDFNIQLNGSLTRDITVQIFDTKNKLITSRVYKSTGDFMQPLNLYYLQSGMYIVRVSDGKRTINKKIIIY